MKKPKSHPTENFIAALAEHASFAPLEVGKTYKFRNHTGAGSYTNDEAVCYARHIQQVVNLLAKGGTSRIPYLAANGELLEMVAK